ncbi:hypothetical protein [Belnapia sp. F-4-1]|uniref:hypothetical protein n=1 Tax=Belnapia sp. F-4-1 TaxID=1545443 RepID=UPI001916FEBF|nr:hypothetical protein [Belnapia sp. F-4-1]
MTALDRGKVHRERVHIEPDVLEHVGRDRAAELGFMDALEDHHGDLPPVMAALREHGPSGGEVAALAQHLPAGLRVERRTRNEEPVHQVAQHRSLATAFRAKTGAPP